MPLNHVSIRVSDLDASVKWYCEALKPAGYRVWKKFPGVVGLAATVPDIWLVQDKLMSSSDDEKSPKDHRITQQHVCFDAGSRAEVRRFHEAALKAGATDNGKPGLRDYAPGYYAAFVLDPDGHNIEACCFSPWWIYAIRYSKFVVGAAVLIGGYLIGKKGLI